MRKKNIFKLLTISIFGISVISGCNNSTNSSSSVASSSEVSSSVISNSSSSIITSSTSSNTSISSTQAPTISSISITGTYKMEYLTGEELDLTGVTLAVTYSNGDRETIPVTIDMITPVDMTTAGTKEVIVTYEGKTTSFFIVIKENVIEKINPTVTFSIESGATLTIGEDEAPTVTVTEGLSYVTYYEQDEVKVSDTLPTTPGRYSFIVEVAGNDYYNDYRTYIWFDLIEPSDKLDPEITFSIESGTTLTIGKDPEPTVTVSEGADYVVYYEQNEVKVSDTLPTTPGTYSLIVEVSENDTYKEAREYRWFYLVEDKLTPEVSFSIESGAELTIGVDSEPTVTVTSGLDYTIHYEQNETFYSNTFPAEAGTYAMVVNVTGNDEYNGVTKWVVFTLVTSSEIVEKLDPEITFSIESGATLTIGVDPEPTITVSEGADYVVYYEQNEVKVSDTFPTTPGTYSLIVEVSENDTYNKARVWRWFNLVENKLTPEVTFSIESQAELTIGVDSEPTVTVTSGLDYTIHYEQNETFYSNTFPTEAGTYSMVVNVTGNDEYNSVTRWVVFTLVETSEVAA